MMVAAKEVISLAGVNLWMLGLRSLFKYIQVKHDWTEDEAWARIRIELIPRSNPEEWELQTIRAVLVEEHNLTLEEAKYWYARAAGETPLIDALRALMQVGSDEPLNPRG